MRYMKVISKTMKARKDLGARGLIIYVDFSVK